MDKTILFKQLYEASLLLTINKIIIIYIVPGKYITTFKIHENSGNGF